MARVGARFMDGASPKGELRYETPDHINQATVTLDMLMSDHPRYVAARTAITRRVLNILYPCDLEAAKNPFEEHWVAWFLDYHLKPNANQKLLADTLEDDQIEDFIIGRAIRDGLNEAAKYGGVA